MVTANELRELSKDLLMLSLFRASLLVDEAADALEATPTAPKVTETELPQDVIDLVIAAREFWDANDDLSPESRALDKALEEFSSRVPYAEEPDALTAAQEIGE